MIDVGTGPPLVLIPGIQGRCEWMKPTIDALAKDWRVIAASLPGTVRDFDSFVEHIDGVLDEAGIRTAVVCGVSFGGFIALRYAARRPGRVRALVLVSAPGPRWKPTPKLLRYMTWPTLSSPLFFLGAVGRLWPELRVTYPDLRSRLGFCAAAIGRVLTAPAVPSRMGRRARLAAMERFESDCARIAVPTLVVTGERGLDRVINQEETLEYLALIQGAGFHLFHSTGHLGFVSAPDAFAAIVSRFVNHHD
jgi:pimeloyl-ACP methyl ester carboxylesterase